MSEFEPIPTDPDSTRIKEASYNRRTRTLRVEFKKGGVYDYADVPADIADSMASAASAGRFLDAEIKGKYAYQRVAW